MLDDQGQLFDPTPAPKPGRFIEPNLSANERHQSSRNQGNATHGMSDTPEYKAWQNMRLRCENPKIKEYKHYGGRGITVCEEWAGPNGFLKFYEYIGPRPSPDHSVDRIDNEGNYEPGNVKWSTRVEQAINTRPHSRSQNAQGWTKTKKGYQAQITIDGQTQYLGLYPTEEEAHYVYSNALKKMSRVEDNVTSIIAAKMALPKIKGHKKIVLDAFIERGNYGYTHEELGERVPIRADTARKRTKDLVDAGFIEDSGNKRKVSSGNMSIVWRATGKAYREGQQDDI